jgi:hypothetical protein
VVSHLSFGFAAASGPERSEVAIAFSPPLQRWGQIIARSAFRSAEGAVLNSPIRRHRTLSSVAMAYFPLLYRWRGGLRLLLWQSGDTDSVCVNSDGYLYSFSSPADLNSFADANQMRIEDEEPRLHDLDSIETWIGGQKSDVDCVATLNAWNLFCDVANSVENPLKENFEKIDAEMSDVYDKVFWSNNLPAVTPPGKKFVPTWSAEELQALAALLSAGLIMFTSCTQKGSYKTDNS